MMPTRESAAGPAGSTECVSCLSCGGEMAFSPEKQVLNCSHCGSVAAVEVEQRPIKDYDLNRADDSANINWGALKKVFHCNNCGAETIVDGQSASSYCAFCGSSHVVSFEGGAGVAPEGLVPFKVPRSKAIENFTTWIKKRRFAPSALKSNYRKQSISGAYIPFWAYSFETESFYSAEAGTSYTVTERVTVTREGKKVAEPKQVKKIRWQPVSGSYSQGFRDRMINASKQIKDRIIARVEPYNLNELVPYAPGFVTGFLAEKYSLGLKDGFEEAKKRVEREIESAIKRQIGADEVRNLSISTTYRQARYKQILLPVWISSYTFNQKIFHFMVNGQNGKVSGEAPVSGVKVVGFIAAIAAVITALVLLLR